MLSIITAISLVALVGCSQEIEKVEYVAEMTDTVPSLTQSFAGLYGLYANPIAHTPTEWAEEFRKHKTEIEDEYEDVKGLTPLDTLQDAHNSLLSVLELTIDTNTVIDEQLKKGEAIDYKNYLNKMTELKAGLEQSLTLITEGK